MSTTRSQKLKLSNGIQLYCCSMGKLFRVTSVCDTVDQANAVMERDANQTMIAEDQAGRIYLAEQYGAVAPSAIIADMRRAA